MAVTDYSTTAADNTSVGGVSIAEGWAPANVNNAIRALMADIASGIDDGDFATTSGFQPLDATLTALAGLATGADKFAYSTGTDTFAEADITSYGRTLLGLANAAALKAQVAGVSVVASSIANPGYVSLDFTGNGTTDLTIQWGTGSISANSTSTISYPTAFTSFAICVAVGGRTGGNTSTEGDVHPYQASGLTSQAIAYSGTGSAFYSWIAIGR
jgi:hypothetical protein